MRDFIGIDHLFDEDFARRVDHRFHSQGAPVGFFKINQLEAEERGQNFAGARWAVLTDMAWVVCLCHGGAISVDVARKVLVPLKGILDDEKSLPGVSGEERLAPLLDNDMDLASVVNYGRTLQEPMLRLTLREHLLKTFDCVLELLETFHAIGMENLETILVGYTHMNHGQPITIAHWMNSVFDGAYRCLEQLELAYKHANRNTGGCGSCSGTTWPVDRWELTRLLGFDDLVEPTYDCEAAQDHSLSVLFSLSNLAVLISQISTNMRVFCMDEISYVKTDPAWCGCSSFMPQKCDSGSNYENATNRAVDVIGTMVTAVTLLKSEFHSDVLPTFRAPNYAVEGMFHARTATRWISSMLKKTYFDKERMLKTVRNGYSCATELASYLIKEKGYGGRLAHSVTATMIRLARCQGLKSFECTGEMLDEAAEYLNVRKPGLDTKTVRRCLDPLEFVKTHTNIGGVSPDENKRLLDIRRTRLDEARGRQSERRSRIADGEGLLLRNVMEICVQ